MQIESIQANSPLTLKAVVVPANAPPFPLIHDLPQRALDRFIEDIEREARGAPAHYNVRKFLHALPEGLKEQRYLHRVDGQTVREARIGPTMEIIEGLRAPHLIELKGAVVGVGFEPGRHEVKVRASSGESLTFAADRTQVDAALAFRSSDVHILAVAEGNRRRLLYCGLTPPTIAPAEKRLDDVFVTWQGLLSRLAK